MITLIRYSGHDTRLLRVTRYEHAASLIVSMAGTIILWLPTTTS
jgi:hypothetical protein